MRDDNRIRIGNREVVAPNPANNARWRVRDNLLGVRDFCPQAQRTADLERALKLDVRERIARLEGQFSAELVMRSAVWLSIKESHASFAIEHEPRSIASSASRRSWSSGSGNRGIH